VNVDRAGVALHGYSATSYNGEDSPGKGNPQYRSVYHGAIYLFENVAEKEKFERNPEHWTPLFGGFCVYGVSQGRLDDVNPARYIRYSMDRELYPEGKLLLFQDSNAFAQFSNDWDGNLKKAMTNWSALVASRGQ